MTQDELRAILTYHPDTGAFTWAAKTSSKVVVGSIAGHKNRLGYIMIGIAGKVYYAHRLAFIWMTGRAPPQVDHANGDKWNNSWGNLRAANHQQNVLNAKRSEHNTSGFKGVSWHRRAAKWSAYIILDGRKRHLGMHETPEAAHAAYLAAAIAAQPDFARAA